MESGGYEFYYELMATEERVAYRIMYDGFRLCADSFVVARCEYGKIHEIYEKVTDDHPEIFYVKAIKIQSLRFVSGYRIIPQYRFSKEEISCVIDEVARQISPLVDECSRKSDIEAEQLIHDYIVRKVTYKDLDAPYSHEMPGVFLYGIGVCEGIAKAFKFLCDKVGIKSGVIAGNVKGEPVAHAWNMVRIDGNWYNVDVTFDANLTKYSGDMRYDYYNVADFELADRKSFYIIPSCSTYYGFYKKSSRYAACQSDLKRIIRKRTGEMVSVQLPQLECSEEQLRDCLFKTVSDSIWGFGKYEIIIYPNYDMNVFTIKIA